MIVCKKFYLHDLYSSRLYHTLFLSYLWFLWFSPYFDFCFGQTLFSLSRFLAHWINVLWEELFEGTSKNELIWQRVCRLYRKKKHLAFVERCFEAGKCWLVTNVRIRAICYTICARENKCLVFWKRHKQERSHLRIFPPFLDKKGETFCCFSVWLQSDLYNDQFINRERNEEAY